MDTNPVLVVGVLLYVGLPLLCAMSFGYKVTRVIDLWQPRDGQVPAGVALEVREQAPGQVMEPKEDTMREWHPSTG